ncbi:hypothetical protein SAMN02745866_03843 [Alteromonadaceae bacterium Bs31]|nr:hypothetical protein SAMN02745866_03843 [Alteromonadaceae bacterium Bs31]
MYMSCSSINLFFLRLFHTRLYIGGQDIVYILVEFVDLIDMET